MVSAPFEYTRVVSYDAAVQALSDHDEDAKLLAGGQSLVPMLNLGWSGPRCSSTSTPRTTASRTWTPAAWCFRP
jgi:hypothetical protein